MKTPEFCPNCSEPVPRNAKSCPHCGSDESTGWSEDALSHHDSVPDQDFDYDDFVRREFAESSPAQSPKPTHISWLWWIVGIVLLALIALPWLFSVFR